MHDIARQFASVKELKELKEAVKKELRICRVVKSGAQNFKELADQCAVEGRSAIVRKAIGEYATEPTRQRPKTWSYWGE
jgi:bacterioferritin-associated ferredoxin